MNPSNHINIPTQIPRYYNNIQKLLQKNRVLVIYGPRRSGKTTLLQNFLSKTNLKYKLDSGDNIQTQDILGSQDFTRIKSYCEGINLLIIDEAQNIPNIGMGLKIIVDNIPDIYVIATGSSSFDLANKVGEPLVGRQRVLLLYPVSLLELKDLNTPYEIDTKIEDCMIFGMYPEVLTTPTVKAKIELLENHLQSLLLKDILALERVKSPKLLLDLLKLLAFQIGNEVSLNELANNLNIDAKTVARYLDLLEKTFIIKSLPGYRRNLRTTVYKKQKYYFLDTGIRNAVISSFNSIDKRNDLGQLWENFLFSERLKAREYREIPANLYFWRSYTQKEIDLVEERNGQLWGYEFKWQNEKLHPPKEWTDPYQKTSYEVVSRENYLNFVT